MGGASQLVSAYIADGRNRSVSYASDMSGQVLRRDEQDNVYNQGDPHEIWYRFGGKQMGYVGNNGTTDVDYQASIAQRTAASPTGVAGAFRNGATTGTGYSDFDQSYNPINSYEQGSGGGGYVVRKGDTLAGLAAGPYGDGSRPSGLLRLELIPRINSCAHAHRLRRVQDRRGQRPLWPIRPHRRPKPDPPRRRHPQHKQRQHLPTL